MEEKKKKSGKKHAALPWLILLLLAAVAGLLVWRGVLWANMPSLRRYPVRGVDVSHYQGSIDWTKIASQKIRFAFIKATEGSGTKDECFAENWKNARAAGIYAGAYHFFSFESAAETQADNFISAVPDDDNALPPVIDLEYYKGGNPPDAVTLRESLRTMLTRMRKAYGKRPIIYTTSACYDAYLKGSDLDYTLWMRSVYTAPGGEPAEKWSFWQYHPYAMLDGYTGGTDRIDLNVYRGTMEMFTREFDLKPIVRPQ